MVPMIKVKMLLTLGTVLILSVALFSCSSHPNAENGLKDGKAGVTQEARDAQVAKDFDKVIQLLEPALDAVKEQSEQAEALHLLGKAYFMRAEESISHIPIQTRMFQPMPGETISDLSKAYQYLDEASWLLQDRELLVETHYFAGKAQDAGYLQDFQKASDHYKQAFSLSATGEYGKLALERYAELAKWFDKYQEQ